MHKFPYKWQLADGYPAKGIDKHGSSVFGTFICGGGSSMGYKLAGYNHLGGVEIDPQVAAVYQANHHPKYLYNEDIREFVKRSDLPDELYSLDLLDGSPPCSSFSMAGNREKDWNKQKQFREGQAHQKLDDLFFEYIALAKRLQPKVVLAENVKGLIQGNAKFYVSQIKKEFELAGYKVQLFLLNAASMGVPQKRERVFFICQREDLKLPELRLAFNEPSVTYSQFKSDIHSNIIKSAHRLKLLSKSTASGVLQIEKASIGGRVGAVGFAYALLDEAVPNTLTANSDVLIKEKGCYANDEELAQIGSYPLDYNFRDIQPKYLIGMSVPPVMCAQIAHQIWLQWLSKIKSTSVTP